VLGIPYTFSQALTLIIENVSKRDERKSNKETACKERMGLVETISVGPCEVHPGTEQKKYEYSNP
jgi:hypothetical protein